MTAKQSAKVKAAKAKISALDKLFDEIVADMTKTPMTKKEYDEIERALYSKCEDFIYTLQTM